MFLSITIELKLQTFNSATKLSFSTRTVESHFPNLMCTHMYK